MRGIVGPFSLLALLEIDNLGRVAAVAFDETAPVRDLIGQGGHFSPVRFQQIFQLGDPRRLLRVKVAGVIDRLFGGVALLCNWCYESQWQVEVARKSGDGQDDA